MVVVLRIDPDDDKADRQRLEELVVMQLLRSSGSRVEQPVLSAGREPAAGTVIVAGDVDVQRRVPNFRRAIDRGRASKRDPARKKSSSARRTWCES